MCCTGWCSLLACTDLPCGKENVYPSFYNIGYLYNLYVPACAYRWLVFWLFWLMYVPSCGGEPHVGAHGKYGLSTWGHASS